MIDFDLVQGANLGVPKPPETALTTESTLPQNKTLDPVIFDTLNLSWLSFLFITLISYESYVILICHSKVLKVVPIWLSEHKGHFIPKFFVREKTLMPPSALSQFNLAWKSQNIKGSKTSFWGIMVSRIYVVPGGFQVNIPGLNFKKIP